MKIVLLQNRRLALQQKYKVTRSMVSLALNFHQHGVVSRRIRHDAINKYYGVLLG